MNDLTQIELSELYDLLAHLTNLYMKMLSQGATRLEFDQCGENMMAVQTEIKVRNYQIRVNKATPADIPNLSVNSNRTGG